VSRSQHKVAALKESIARKTARAIAMENRLKISREEFRATKQRIKLSNKQIDQLVQLLRRVNAQLRANNLMEISSTLRAAVTNEEHSSLLLAIVAKIESGSDVSEVHQMIDTLIKTLLKDKSVNQDNLIRAKKSVGPMRRSQITLVNALRKQTKSLIKSRDSLVAGVSKSKVNLNALSTQLAAGRRQLKASRSIHKQLKKTCKGDSRSWLARRVRLQKKLRVLRGLSKKLRQQNFPDQLRVQIAQIKVDLPYWQLGEWSDCSADCGLGKMTRTVECTGNTCRGRKPATSSHCSNGPCQADCIVSRWSKFSKCSAKCGGGQKTRTRKILAQTSGKGLACPAPSGLKKVAACNMHKCKEAEVPARLQPCVLKGTCPYGCWNSLSCPAGMSHYGDGSACQGGGKASCDLSFCWNWGNQGNAPLQKCELPALTYEVYDCALSGTCPLWSWTQLPCPAGQKHYGDGSACSGGGLPSCDLSFSWNPANKGNGDIPKCRVPELERRALKCAKTKSCPSWAWIHVPCPAGMTRYGDGSACRGGGRSNCDLGFVSNAANALPACPITFESEEADE
jgi:hypothetical protein